MFQCDDPRKIIGIVKGNQIGWIQPDLYVCRNCDNGKLLLSLGFGQEFEPQVSLARSEVATLIKILKKAHDESNCDNTEKSFKLFQHKETVLEYKFTLKNNVGHLDLIFSDEFENNSQFSLAWGADLQLIEYLESPDQHMVYFENESKVKFKSKIYSGKYFISASIICAVFLGLAFTPHINNYVIAFLCFLGATGIADTIVTVIILGEDRDHIQVNKLKLRINALELDLRSMRYCADFNHRTVIERMERERSHFIKET